MSSLFGGSSGMSSVASCNVALLFFFLVWVARVCLVWFEFSCLVRRSCPNLTKFHLHCTVEGYLMVASLSGVNLSTLHVSKFFFALSLGQAATLKFLAENYNIPVLLSNQVTTSVAPRARGGRGARGRGSGDAGGGAGCDIDANGGGSCGGQLQDGPRYAVPALGNTWAHSVNTRLILEQVISQ
jgi:uncharacterized membrane protein YgcG